MTTGEEGSKHLTHHNGPEEALTLRPHLDEQESVMSLKWPLAFFILAVIAAVFGFGGIAAGAASIAKILFIVFVAIFILTFIFGLFRD